MPSAPPTGGKAVETRTLGILALLVPLIGCLLAACSSSSLPPVAHGSSVGTGTSGLKTVYVKSAGRRRYYLLYVPPGDSARHPLPLVVAFSGVDDSALATSSSSGLLDTAEQEHNMILAFPEGYDESWNDDAGNPPAEAAGVDDVAFTQTILRGIEQSYHVDLKRVVATGLSNGAILTQLLGCRLAANLTLIAPVEGQLAPKFAGTCDPADPVSVYEVHGTDDQTIPYGGGTFAGVGGPVTVLSAPASAQRWASLNQCSAKSTKSKSGNSILTKYDGCAQGVTVTLESIQGGSHEWPPNFGSTLSSTMTSLSGEREAVTP